MVVMLFGGVGQVHAVNIIANGSFETGDFTGWGVVDIVPPFFPAAVRPAGVSPGLGLFATAPTDGSFVASHGFDGGGPGTIEIFQDIIVGPGASATLTFDYRAGWDFFACAGCTGVRMLDVDIETFGGGSTLASTGILLADPVVTSALLDTGALSATVDLSAFLGSAIRLNFLTTIPESFTGPAHLQLDNIKLDVAPIPEPATMMLFGTGLIGLAAWRRFKKTA